MTVLAGRWQLHKPPPFHHPPLGNLAAHHVSSLSLVRRRAASMGILTAHAQGTPEPWSFRDAFRHGTAAGGCWQHGELWQAYPPVPCLQLGHSFPWCPWHYLPQRGRTQINGALTILFHGAPPKAVTHIDKSIATPTGSASDHATTANGRRRTPAARPGRTRPSFFQLDTRNRFLCGSWVRPRWAAGDAIGRDWR